MKAISRRSPVYFLTVSQTPTNTITRPANFSQPRERASISNRPKWSIRVAMINCPAIIRVMAAATPMLGMIRTWLLIRTMPSRPAASAYQGTFCHSSRLPALEAFETVANGTAEMDDEDTFHDPQVLIDEAGKRCLQTDGQSAGETDQADEQKIVHAFFSASRAESSASRIISSKVF